MRTRAIPERLRGVFTTRRYTNSRLPLPAWVFLFGSWVIIQASECCCATGRRLNRRRTSASTATRTTTTTTTTTFQEDDAAQRPHPHRRTTELFSTATAAASPRSRPLSTSCPTGETSLPTVDVSPPTEDITLPSGSTPIPRPHRLLPNALFISRLFTLTAHTASTTALTLLHTSSDNSTTRSFFSVHLC